MRILGIVIRTHDSGLALLDRGVPTMVLEEERFNREKHTRKFPFGSIKAAFDDRGLSLADIDLMSRNSFIRFPATLPREGSSVGFKDVLKSVLVRWEIGPSWQTRGMWT